MVRMRLFVWVDLIMLGMTLCCCLNTPDPSPSLYLAGLG